MNSLIKKCFEKHKFCLYFRLILSLRIILASDGLVLSVTRIFVYKNGPLAMWLRPQGLSWSRSASVAEDLGSQAWTPWQGPAHPGFTLPAFDTDVFRVVT